MKKIVLPLLATLTVLLLSACSIISDLIPEQEVELFSADAGSVESVSEVLSEPPRSIQDFFEGEDSSSLVSQADEKYIAINLYKEVLDLDEDASFRPGFVTQEIGVNKIILESAVETEFPDEIRGSFLNPTFSVWDDFVGPEEDIWFWALPEERRNALFTSYVEALNRELAVFVDSNDDVFTFNFREGAEWKLEEQGTFYTKNNNDCSKTRCVYEASGIHYCWREIGGPLQCQNSRDKSVVESWGFRYTLVLDKDLLSTINEILSEGKNENSVSLSVWMKVQSTSSIAIPNNVTATSTLYLPPAKAKADFSSN